MDRDLPLDEVTLIENKLGIKVYSTDQLRDTVIKECWGSLLSTDEKRLKFRSKIMEIKGHKVDFGGCGGAQYIFNPDGHHDVFNKINECITHFASKLGLPISFKPQDSTGSEILVTRISPHDWTDIPDTVAMEMLESIESKLRSATVGFVVFTDFLNAPPLLRSYALNLFDKQNVAVFLTSSIDLSFLDNSVFNSFMSDDYENYQGARPCLLTPSSDSVKRAISELNPTEV
ncbi:conserved hypothetical protein [Vibrio chagasii]|uniref:hypothetical protein n=1 Tax=Vibrio splendidus TaxID=29497 RepID=UPI0033857B79|nr:conserved hypothetical protein [Vibrio chagasii]CAH6950182.1 conserved hypothetical protein [Vibrio chagasii]